MNISKLRKVIHAGRIEWRKHALQRLAERRIKQKTVLKVLSSGELIEDYPDDKPYPSALFMRLENEECLHVVIALDDENDVAHIITAYQPSLDDFEDDFRTRRT